MMRRGSRECQVCSPVLGLASAAGPGYSRAMKLTTVVALILIVIGVVALAYQGITYTTSEKVVDLGPLKVETQREKTIPVPPIVGIAALVLGVIASGARSAVI